MKIRRIIENGEVGLPIYEHDITSMSDWLRIKKSGKFNPETVKCDFYTKYENLTSLVGAPEYVHGKFTSFHNLITNFVGGPKWVSDTLDYDANKLNSFEGAPEFVGGSVYITKNKFESLSNIHKHVKTINKRLYINDNPIKSHLLGVLLIKNLQGVHGSERIVGIINKHLAGDRDILECQEEMISAGLKEFAKL